MLAVVLLRAEAGLVNLYNFVPLANETHHVVEALGNRLSLLLLWSQIGTTDSGSKALLGDASSSVYGAQLSHGNALSKLVLEGLGAGSQAAAHMVL